MRSRNTSIWEEEQQMRVVASNIASDAKEIKNLRGLIASFLEQADAQFKCGDRYATYSKETIRAFKAALKDSAK